MACFLMKSVDTKLPEHPAIQANAPRFKLASTAHQPLFKLYQTIGAQASDGVQSNNDPSHFG